MAKHFIKVTNRYSTKSRVQELILMNLEELDHVLVAKKQDTTNLIRNAYQRAIKQHTGSGAIPKLKEYDGDHAKVFQVENVIHLTSYEVKVDFSH